MKTSMKIIGPAALAATFFAGWASAEDKVLRFATWDSDESLGIEEAIAKKFEETHPGVKVQVEAYGDGYDQKLTAAMGAGSARAAKSTQTIILEPPRQQRES